VHPEWSKDASIYQINTRQFTAEGTFRAAEAHLPRLKDLGVDILWLMPVHPIGEQNRKGSLGSPYAVKDYYGVNPEFGTLDDLKHFVQAAHSQGMYVILDWVANHTAWDNVLVQQHPEWYARDWKGDFRPTPWWDWPDIIDLNYDLPEVRQYMTEALCWWAPRWTWTASAATWPASCPPTSGTRRARRWTRSSRSSCWPSGSPGTCTPRPST
jgi:glycosidase